MEKLPSEILSIIFSFLDKKSRKSATSTCHLWFDLIRNSNLSNHICYKDSDSKDSVKKLQQRIENLEWDWKRWPALKKFEILEFNSCKKDLLNDLSIDFKQCSTLELVKFCVSIDIANLFPNCPRNVARIRKLAFNPQLDITQFGLDHIWSLQVMQKNDEVFKMINENVKGLKELVCNFSYLSRLDNMDSLLKLHIIDNFSKNFESELKIAGLKKLKTLTVGNLAQLNKFVGMDALLELSVTRGSGLKEYDLSNIAKRFKNLQKCEICVQYELMSMLSIQPKEYVQIVQDIFQNVATRVEIVFVKSSKSTRSFPKTYVIKEPFQRCAVKR